ncbi:MAG: glycosyltransferase family 39 protein [Betaproteobacteria bacterium]|nr:glycosyltransferase family 39 protein [Betaproteobacteria bacterium]
MFDRRPSAPVAFLLLIGALSLAAKLAVLKVGGPFVSIDDRTTFEGGFLVLFGQAQPQRMYLESWITGLLCLANYGFRIVTGAVPGGLGLNLVADAYRDYYLRPDSYVHVYRAFVIMVDLIAAVLTWRLARRFLGDAWRGWAAVLPPAMYLLTYNTIWADVVARPDAMLPLFMTAGLLLYYRSDFGRHQGWLLGSGFVLGLGAGLKLHLAFAVVFLLADLIRVHGWRGALRTGWGFAALSLLAFLVSAGIPLFDPLKYVKLRLTNAKDDASPWIRWGEQFLAMLRGSGWVVLPLAVGAIVHRGPLSFRRSHPLAASLLLQTAAWLVLFGLIRQLRAYWMLPALPVFYLAAVAFLVAVVRARPSLGRVVAAWAVLALSVLALQSGREVARFRAVDQNGLRSWVQKNVSKDEPFFVFGFDALVLPRRTSCLAVIADGIRRGVAGDRAAGVPFTERHLKIWEEETELARQDMLGGRCDDGWEHYTYYTTPFERYEGLIDMNRMRYVLVQDQFADPPDFPLDRYLADSFRFVTELTGAGGEGYGLKYRVYRRGAADGS